MSELNTKTLSELTTVDSLENTDTLLIESEGQMKKVSPSVISGGGGGDSGLIVNIDVQPPESLDDDEFTVVSRSATYSEIKTAIAKGINVSVRCTVEGSDTGDFLQLARSNSGEGTEYIEFIGYTLSRRGSGPLNITTHSYYVDPSGDGYSETLFRVTIAS